MIINYIYVRLVVIKNQYFQILNLFQSPTKHETNSMFIFTFTNYTSMTMTIHICYYYYCVCCYCYY